MKILTTMVIAVVLLYMYLGDLGKVDDDYMTDKVHCEITVQEVLEGAIVRYNNAVVPDHSYEIFVEVEYSDDGELDWELLEYLTDEVVIRMKEDCNNNHKNQ